MKTIAVLGTFDTKAQELEFVADRIRSGGFHVLRIDVGSRPSASVRAEITREQVLRHIGASVSDLVDDRGTCVTLMGKAAAAIIPDLAARRDIDGILSLGGGGGTSIATAAMRALPVGFPKLMVSTVASGDTSGYVGTKDVVMFPSVVDVAGLNRLSRTIFARAAGAICGMVSATVDLAESKPLVVASMFGNTTRCIEIARQRLEAAGFEVLVFHATGTGGRAMEDLIASGLVAGVLDITTTELADELLGGIMSAGPDRLSAAAHAGVPTVIAPGCLDMANFGPPETVPSQYQTRTLYQHNPDNTLLRVNAEESATLGKQIARKLDAYGDRVSVLIPTKGISVISAEGQPFYDPDADAALFDAISQTIKPVRRVAAEINEDSFAQAAADELLRLISAKI